MSASQPVGVCDCETRLAQLEAAVFSTGEYQGKTIGELMRQIWAMPPVVLPPQAGLEAARSDIEAARSDIGNVAGGRILTIESIKVRDLDDGHLWQVTAEVTVATDLTVTGTPAYEAVAAVLGAAVLDTSESSVTDALAGQTSTGSSADRQGGTT